MGTLRIIGGNWRSRLLESPEGFDTRPLTDRIRQSLFDVLGQRMDGLVVADCFAGSGSFGFEALSRGAKEVHAVEIGPLAINCLRRNAETLQCTNRHHLHRAALPGAANLLPPCDIIFVDPPFPWFREQPELLAEVLSALLTRLAPGGELVVRGEKGEKLPLISNSKQLQRREYGRSWVVWLSMA